MPVRQDLPYLQIHIHHFQEFDRGLPVTQEMPAGWLLEPGDQFEYECGQNIHGFAVMLSWTRASISTINGVFQKIT